MPRYSHVERAVTGRPWAILPDQLDAIAEVLALRLDGGGFTDEQIVARVEAASAAAGSRAGRRVSGSVAILPIYGTLMPRASLMTAMSGGASVDGIRSAFREAMADDTIGSLILEFDSPGGQVDGIEELATEIRGARGQKPIVAIANTTMASAAYWLAAQADELVATPTALVGSIGVVALHFDRSREYDTAGITPTIVRAPEGKIAANEYEPLGDAGRSEMEQMVADYYGLFTTAVARGRGVSVDTVREKYGKGGVMTAKRAQAAGLVDRVETLDATIKRLASGRAKVGRAADAVAAAIDVPRGMLPDDPVGMVEQQAAAQSGLDDAADALLSSLRLELDADAWRLAS